MKQKNNDNKDKETPKGPGIGDPFSGGDDAPAESKEVMVGSGVYLEKLPVGGMTVAQVRDKYSDRMDIAPGADAFIDGKKVDADTVLQHGQMLRFAHKAGEKGL